MNEFIEKNRRLLRFFCFAAQIIGWMLVDGQQEFDTFDARIHEYHDPRFDRLRAGDLAGGSGERWRSLRPGNHGPTGT